MVTRTAPRPPANIDLPVLDGDFVDQSFERVTGAELIHGHSVELLIDAAENYPQWLAAIEAAERRIFF